MSLDKYIHIYVDICAVTTQKSKQDIFIIGKYFHVPFAASSLSPAPGNH